MISTTKKESYIHMFGYIKVSIIELNNAHQACRVCLAIIQLLLTTFSFFFINQTF